MLEAWQLFWSLTRQQVESYLDQRKAQGFNAVFAVVLSELKWVLFSSSGLTFAAEDQVRTSECTRRGLMPTNPRYQRWNGSEGSRTFHPSVHGEVPLVNDDPSRPNEAFFAHVDWCIEQMIQRDIIPFLVPTWGRYVNSGMCEQM